MNTGKNTGKTGRKLFARIAVSMLCAAMAVSMMPAAVMAEDGSANEYGIVLLDGENASFSVVSSDGTPVTAENGVYTLTGGSYTVSGTAAETESIKIAGDVSLTLENAKILHSTDKIKDKDTDSINACTPAISVESGNVTLNLVGENAVRGSVGFAGIYVAPNASLTISGEGKLNAKGGDGSDTVRNISIESYTSVYWGGGAGIGGNGVWVSGSDEAISTRNTSDFGTVTIKSGEITSEGGKANTAAAGGSAGIGSGGASIKVDENILFKGIIQIDGGTINAIGGEGEDRSLTGGGAGIGSGSAIGDFHGLFYTASNEIIVTILDGDVTATGTADGAGIGGGANVDGGIIKISGGTVNATGGYEIDSGAQDGAYGGAGIGGGDNGGVTSIEITGGTVTAKAVGAAAGIGAGNDGEIGAGTISISGNADVTAFGGSHARKTNGGAGIGGGRSYYNDVGFDSISITGNAKVHAYAGVKAQAIGVGSYYGGDFANKITFGDKVSVWMFNQHTFNGSTFNEDTAISACWGLNDTIDGNYVTTDANPIWYKSAEETLPAGGDALSKEGEYKWTLDGNKLTVTDKDGKEVASESYPDEFTACGNWAVILPKEDNTPDTPDTPVTPVDPVQPEEPSYNPIFSGGSSSSTKVSYTESHDNDCWTPSFIGKWLSSEGKTYYVNGNDEMLRNGWQKIEKKYYYFNADGERIENSWILDGNKWYYVGEDGARLTNTEKDGYKLSASGSVVGEKPSPESYFDTASDSVHDHFTSSCADKDCWRGKFKEHWVLCEGNWYYIKASEVPAQSEWVKSGNNWYHFDKNEVMQSATWIQDGGKWYYLGADGAMYANKWRCTKGVWYYLLGSGEMAKNRWVEDKGNWYYLGSDGGMLVNTVTPDGYTVNENGVWVK